VRTSSGRSASGSRSSGSSCGHQQPHVTTRAASLRVYHAAASCERVQMSTPTLTAEQDGHNIALRTAGL